MILISKKCTIWNDVRTYLTSQIDPKEKVELIIAISHFKNKEEKQEVIT